MSNKCNQCHINPCWFDTTSNKYSPYCSNTCRQSAGGIGYNPTPAVMGQPLCQICSNAAFYDVNSKKYSPGCGRTHAQQAMARGLYGPRG